MIMCLKWVGKRSSFWNKILMRANTKTMETEQQPSENSLPMVVNPEDQKINPQVKRIRKYKRGTHSPEPNNFRLKQQTLLPQYPEQDLLGMQAPKLSPLNISQRTMSQKDKEITKIYIGKSKRKIFVGNNDRTMNILGKQAQTERQQWNTSVSPSNQNNKSDNARVVREAYDGNIKSRRKRYSVIEDEHEETVLPKKKLQHIHNLRINQTVAGFYERPEERVQRIDKLYLAAQGLKKEKLGISQCKEYLNQNTVFYNMTLQIKPIVWPEDHFLRMFVDKDDTIIGKGSAFGQNGYDSKTTKESTINSLKDENPSEGTRNLLMSTIAEKEQPNQFIQSSNQKQIPLGILSRRDSQLRNHKREQISTKDYIVQVPQVIKSKEDQPDSVPYSNVRIVNQCDSKDVNQIINKYHPKSDIFKNISLSQFKIKKYKNGVYFGHLDAEERKQDKGILFYSNGRIYQGEFADDAKQGKGMETFPDGSEYRGEYRRGMKQGRGVFQWPNGELYDGQWKKGQKTGSGLWHSSDGQSYIGEWKNDHVQGFGVYVMKSGTRYEGQFHNSLKHGVGTERYPNGETYVGSYERNRQCGQGQYFWSNGNYHKGKYMNGLKHGLGYFRDERAGIEYKGQYRNDKKCGYGQLTLPDHTVYRGNFENDFRHGFGEVFLNNTCIYSGYWINDQKIEQSLIEQDASKPKVAKPAMKPKVKFTRIDFERITSQAKLKAHSLSKSPIPKQLKQCSPFQRRCCCNKKH